MNDASVCTVHGDCCSCLALGPGEVAPACSDTTCKASQCELLGMPTAECHVGQCTLARSCDASRVTCKSIPPSCPPGSMPGVDETSMCWTNTCVLATECTAVKSCDDCKAAGLSCVQEIGLIGSFHCVAVPAPCTDPSCACMGPGVCLSPFTICNDGTDGPTCDCPTC